MKVKELIHKLLDMDMKADIFILLGKFCDGNQHSEHDEDFFCGVYGLQTDTSDRIFIEGMYDVRICEDNLQEVLDEWVIKEMTVKEKAKGEGEMKVIEESNK